MPEIRQLVEVPKMMSQNGIQRRTAEQIVDFPAAVLPERVSERVCGHSGVIEVTKISSQDRNLQRTVEQILVDSVEESMSQNLEEISEVDKIALPKRLSERICEHNVVLDLTKNSSLDRNLQRAVEQMLDGSVDRVHVEVVEFNPQVSWWPGDTAETVELRKKFFARYRQRRVPSCVKEALNTASSTVWATRKWEMLFFFFWLSEECEESVLACRGRALPLQASELRMPIMPIVCPSSSGDGCWFLLEPRCLRLQAHQKQPI